MKKARVHILISGLVQGVFFRASIAEKARKLKLTGWARNLPDGKVEAVFEGEREKIEEIFGWAKKGPRIAVIDKVDVEWKRYQGEFSSFEIKYE